MRTPKSASESRGSIAGYGHGVPSLFQLWSAVGLPASARGQQAARTAKKVVCRDRCLEYVG
jgi:hypothetical protein